MTGEMQHVFEGGPFWAIALSPDGKHLATGLHSGSIWLWDTATGKIQQKSQGHGDNVCALAFSSDSKWLASGSIDWSVQLWNIGEDETPQKFQGHTDAVNSCQRLQDHWIHQYVWNQLY